MVRQLLLTLALLMVGVVVYAQTSLAGTVSDADTKETIPDASVRLFKNGVQKGVTVADINGYYRFTALDPGEYDVEVTVVGYTPARVNGVRVLGGKENNADVKIGSGTLLTEVVVTEYKVKLVEQDNTTQGGTVTSKEIRSMPTKSINGIIATVAGAASIDGGAVTIKGSRSSSTFYYIDGIRVSGSLIPQSEIDQLEVMTGGIEALYGDVSGGIISITTKGPSAKTVGGLELETSQYLDPYGYNLASGNLAGPIIKNKAGEAVLGYRISGQYVRRQEDDPPAIPVYRVKDEFLALMEANPVSTFGSSTINTAERYGNDQVDVLKARPYEASHALDLTAKLDARLSDNINVAFFGSYNDSRNQFTPGGWGVYNAHNNPTAYSQRMRGNIRLRHRLGNSLDTTKSTATTIANASYTLQFGFERGTNQTADPRHGDNLFNYGYVGNFNYEWEPIFGQISFPGDSLTALPGNPDITFGNVDYRQNFVDYAAGTANPILANYNNISGSDINKFSTRNGFISDAYDQVWNLHTNVGAVYNSNTHGQNDIITGQANLNFDILPKGNTKKAHNIQAGIIYEQQVNSNYNVAPFRLWEIAQQSANNLHILGVDTNTILYWEQNIPGDLGTIFDSLPVFQTLITTDPEVIGEYKFYKAVRQLTGQSLNDYVNVDGLDPSQLSLDMFSASELNDQAILGYYGNDYLGNPLARDVTFEDFFKQTDADGIRTFPVLSFSPNYLGAYVQDKFRIGDDLIVRAGVRLDRYDANQKVLKDPYSLYEVMSAKEYYETVLQQTKPANIGDDYVVYNDALNSNGIKAFRQGDQWYTSNGTAANDGNAIFGSGGLVYPHYKRSNTTPNRIKERDFDTNESFEDYEPQLNVMPRLAFSFPISDMANFFAHYDVLVQRPSSNSRVSPLDYYYFLSTGRFTDNQRNNANLKPEKTIDYEVGYQQKLGNSSALKLAAFYKEMRDMVQSRTYVNLPAPLNTYSTYGNLDFGTAKGLTVQYDLRRTGNVQATVNYTLAFADGTGSDAGTQLALTKSGSNIRTLFPLNFDERHRVAVTVDYRYDQGNKYNGPRWFGTDVFANMGLNTQIFAVSGRPYTAKFFAQQFGGAGTLGSINGARLPWNLTVDTRLDKTFSIGKKGSSVNVYLRVQNLLNTKNVIGVYPVTGSPSDDGYLRTAQGLQSLETIANSGLDLQSYQDSYQWSLLNPNNYTLPRRIFLGALFEF